MRAAKNMVFSLTIAQPETRATDEFVRQVHAWCVHHEAEETPTESVRAVSRLTSFVRARWWRWGRSPHRWAANLIENSWGLSEWGMDQRGEVSQGLNPALEVSVKSLHGGQAPCQPPYVLRMYMRARLNAWCMLTRICRVLSFSAHQDCAMYTIIRYTNRCDLKIFLSEDLRLCIPYTFLKIDAHLQSRSFFSEPFDYLAKLGLYTYLRSWPTLRSAEHNSVPAGPLMHIPPV